MQLFRDNTKKHNKRISLDYTFKNKQAGIKEEFKKPFKADTWQAHGELGRHLLSVIYLSKVRLICGFIVAS